MKKTFWLGLAAVGLLAGCQQGYQFELPPASNEYGQHITYNNKIDVILIMDNSSGMDFYVSKLQSTIGTLINPMLTQKLDLHIGIITTSMGGANPNGGRLIGTPKYLTSSTPNLAGVISARLGEIGANGSDLERGLDSLVEVLSPTYRNGEGAGFLRDDALLAIIALSSEDDASANLTGGLNAYRNYLDQVKGFYDDGSRRWTTNFIGVLSLTGACETTPGMGTKVPGLRWMGLADISNGVKETICSDSFVYASTNIRQRIAHILTDFRLGKEPDLSTLRVFVNNVEVPEDPVNGYSYIPEGYIVRFHGSAIPAADAAIRIDFIPAGAN